jgi:hypothetical protein
MRSRFTIPALATGVFILVSLACNTPTWGEVQPELNLATAAPSSAPTTAPGEAFETEAPPTYEDSATPTAHIQEAEPPSPVAIEGTAILSSYSSGNESNCQAEIQAVLRIPGDGTASLTTTGPSFIDHINCTTSDSNETWITDGIDNPTEQIVRFTTCNGGGFTAEGQISYKDGVIVGKITCFFKNGDIGVELDFGL